ncbi:tyrosine-type recombinase/integrase [Corynebacterium auriscanis]|uniref:tyrosine-type recombinase/integrase n=1 Tax=Corynebacterium auriscanis TaxID=99807 RepID=UPI000B19BB83|nr:site-specific integrase [Corynebacterium auriscanis]
MARGRPVTPLGTWGNINTKTIGEGKVRAETRLRLYDGQTVRIRAIRKSKTAAINEVKARCQERLGVVDTPTLTTTSSVEQLLNYWLEDVDVRGASKDRYRTATNRHLIPAMGAMRLNEVTGAFLQQWLNSQTSGVVPNCRTVLLGAFGMAARFGIVNQNPMLNVKLKKRRSREVRALTEGEVQPFRDQIAASGNQTLIDVVDVCLATGLRAGEVLALRWDDVDLDGNPPRLEVSGTLTYSKGRGMYRQDQGKTSNAMRFVHLSALAVEVLKRRRDLFEGVVDPVFPSGAGTYIWENNFNRWLRAARGERFDWVTVHTLRKTLASVITRHMSPRDAAEVLGHADSRLTEQVYVARAVEGVAIGDVVDRVLKVSK